MIRLLAILPLLLSSCGTVSGLSGGREAAIRAFHDRVGDVGRTVKMSAGEDLHVRSNFSGRNKDGSLTQFTWPKRSTDIEGQGGVKIYNGARFSNAVVKNGDGVRNMGGPGVEEEQNVLHIGQYEGGTKANRNTGKMEIQGSVYAGENTVHDVLSLGGNDIHVGTDIPVVFVSDSDAALVTQRTTHDASDPTKGVQVVKREPTRFVLGPNRYGIRRDKLQQEGDSVVTR